MIPIQIERRAPDLKPDAVESGRLAGVFIDGVGEDTRLGFIGASRSDGGWTSLSFKEKEVFFAAFFKAV